MWPTRTVAVALVGVCRSEDEGRASHGKKEKCGPAFIQAICGVRRSSRVFHLGHAAHVATGSVLPGSGHLQAPHFSFFLWLALPSSSERRTPTSATATVRVGHISSLIRSSDDLLLRLFSVDLVLRLGLNSVHFTSLMTHLGAVRFPPIRRSGARDDSLVCSAMSSLLAF